jgi:signal transduction histidine kinase/DNA-binding response OmpR family regulator
MSLLPSTSIVNLSSALQQATSLRDVAQVLVDALCEQQIVCLIWYLDEAGYPGIVSGKAACGDERLIRRLNEFASAALPWQMHMLRAEESGSGQASVLLPLMHDHALSGWVWIHHEDVESAALLVELMRARLEVMRTHGTQALLLTQMTTLSQTFTGVLDEGQLWSQLYETITSVFDVSSAYVGLIDHGRGVTHLPLVIRDGVRAESQDVAVASICKSVLQHGVEVYFQDLTQEQERLRALGIVPDRDEPGFDARSWMGVPLRSRGSEVIGLISLQHDIPAAFGERDLSLLITLAAQLSLAISHQRLQNLERERRLLADTLMVMGQMVTVAQDYADVFQHLLEQLYRIQAYDAASVWLLDDGSGQLTLVATHDGQQFAAPVTLDLSDQPLLQSIAQAQQPVATGRYSGASFAMTLAPYDVLQAWMGIPLIVMGQLYGMVMVARAAPDYSERDASAAFALTRQAAIAVENLLLNRQRQQNLTILSQRSKRLTSIGRITSVISSALVEADVLNLTVALLAEVFEADHCAAYLLDHLEAEVKAESPITDSIGIRIPMRESVAFESLVRYATAVIIPDVEAEHIDPTTRDLLIRMGGSAAMFAPLTTQRGLVAVISLERRSLQKPFSEEERDTFLTVAGQVALALNNAELYQEALSANRLKSEFLTNISHELRTPLNAIIGYSDMLLQGIYGDLTTQQLDRLGRVYGGGKQLLSMIDNILALARIEAGRAILSMTDVSLMQLLQELVQAAQVAADAKGLRVTFEAEACDLLVQADRDALTQVIVNLLDNAVKFTHEGGITLRCDKLSIFNGETLRGTPPPAHLDVPNGEWMVIEIADTGIGIKPEHQRLIFDEFRQGDGSTVREYGGSGLGLSLARRLLDLMDGYIWLNSEVGKGSTFTLLLRQSEAEGLEMFASESGDYLALLLASDDLLVERVSEVLDGQQLHLLATQQPARFAEAARQLRPAVLLIDATITSVSLWQLLSSLKLDAATASTPLLLLTAQAARLSAVHFRFLDAIPVQDSPDRMAKAIVRVVRPGAHETVVLVGEAAAGLMQGLQRLGFTAVSLRANEINPEALRKQVPALMIVDLTASPVGGLELMRRMSNDLILTDVPFVALVPPAYDTQQRDRIVEWVSQQGQQPLTTEIAMAMGKQAQGRLL